MLPTIKRLVPDLLASVVVVLVALPLSIGIAVACGVSPERGILTAIIGGIVVGFFSGSPLLVSGPAASLIVPVYALVESRGVAALGPVVVLAGVWQLIAGRLKLGTWFRAVAPAVIHGMLIGIGVLIVASQLHVAIDSDARDSFVSNLSEFPQALVEQFGENGGAGALAGAATILLIVGWNRFRPTALRLVPGHLMALLVVVSVVLLLGAPVRYLDVSRQFFAGLELLKFSDVGSFIDLSLIGTSLMFAFVASAATLLTAVAIDQRQSHTRTDYNKEMMAQGLGNSLAGLLGGLPMTGVIVRSSANVDAGAKTRWSTIFHGVWMLIFVAVAPQVLEMIPRASLGAILVYTGFKLIDYKVLRNLYERGRPEFAICVMTLFGVVFIDLFIGILIGLGASVIKIVYTFSHLEMRSRVDERGEHHLTLNGSATFLRLPALAEKLDSIPPDRALHLHVSQLEHIDHACLELLSNWEQQRHSRGDKGLDVDWSLLSSRYHRTFLGLPEERSHEGETAGALLSLMWSEWKRVYAPKTSATAERLNSDWITPQRVLLRIDTSDLDEILELAADVLAPASGMAAPDIVAALRARSSSGQISLGGGVSVPHAPLEGLDRPLAVVITSREPIEVAGESIDIFFVLLAPASDPRLHLLSLAHAGRLCHSQTSLEKLRSSSSSEEVAELLQPDGGKYEGMTAPEEDVRLLAILEIPRNEQVQGVIEFLDQGLTHPAVISDRDGTIFETLRTVLRVSRSQRLALLAIQERDKNVLVGLVAEFSRLSASEGEIRIHFLGPEAVNLPAAAPDELSPVPEQDQGRRSQRS